MRLDNGVWILVLPTPRPASGYRGVASVQLWVAAGAGAERRDEHGCAHLFEHMVFKPRRDASGGERDLAGVIEHLGGDVNAFTSHDETVFHATVPADHVEVAATELLDAVLARGFVAEQLEREQEVVVEEIRQYADDPAAMSVQQLMTDLFAEHAYGRPVLGEEAEVGSLTTGKLLRWRRRMFRGSKVVFVAVGPFELAQVEAIVRARLERLAAGPRGRPSRKPKRPVQARFRVLREDVQEAYLHLGWRGGSGLDEDALALDVAAVALGQGESSRLARGLRRRDRLVSDAYASYLAGIASGTFMLSAQAELDTVEDAVAGLLAEVERLARVPMSAEEFARARALLESSLIYRRETVQGQAHALGYFATISGTLAAEATYFERLAQLTPARVRAVCARHLELERTVGSLVVPRGRVDGRKARSLCARLERRCRGGRARVRRHLREAPRRDELGIWRATHRSGLRVVARPDPSVPIVAAWMVWPGGQRLESSRSAGISSLCAALLNRGTTARDGDAIAAEIEGLAAVLDGFSGHNSVGLQAESLAAHTSTVLARMLECALDPRFDAAELDEARRLVLADLDADADDVGHLSYRTALRALYRGHPHGRDLRGTAESLARLSSGGLARNWRRHYPLGRGVLALAGAFDLDALLVELDEVVDNVGGPLVEPVEGSTMPSWKGGSPRWPRRPVVRELARAREQGHCVIAFPGLCIGDSRGAILDVACSVLGGQAGRLFESLRERQGLVYQVSASSSEHIDSGHVALYAAASQDKLDAARRAMEHELERVRTELISEHELERAKQWLIGQFESGLQRRGRVASRMVFGEVYGLGADYYLRYPERVAAVEREQVLALAAQLLARRSSVTVLARGT